MKIKQFFLVVLLLSTFTLKASYLEYKVKVFGITNSVIQVNHAVTDTLGIFDVHVKTFKAISVFSNVDNYYHSTYVNGFRTNYLRKRIAQSKYSEDREIVIDNNIAYMKDLAKGTEEQYNVFSDTSDLFGGLFKISKDDDFTGSFHIFSNRHIWRAVYEDKEVETINTELGKFEAHRIEVHFLKISEGDFKCTDIFTNNVLRENQLLELWISEDKQIPLKAILHHPKHKVYWNISDYRNEN